MLDGKRLGIDGLFAVEGEDKRVQDEPPLLGPAVDVELEIANPAAERPGAGPPLPLVRECKAGALNGLDALGNLGVEPEEEAVQLVRGDVDE